VLRNGERRVIIGRSSRWGLSRFLVVLCSKASHKPEKSAANATAGRREKQRVLNELAPLKVHPLGGDFARWGDYTDVRHRGLYLLSKASNRRKSHRRRKFLAGRANLPKRQAFMSLDAVIVRRVTNIPKIGLRIRRDLERGANL
jgi:hypothetical protein